MSQIMGLPADNHVKPEAKDMTVFEKGRYAGYKAAVADVLEIINDEMGIHARMQEQIPGNHGAKYDKTGYVTGRISKRIRALTEEEG